jgi:hypothetical protein
MPRYYFDIRDDNDTFVDHEGMELADLKTAQVEAAQSLADLAEELLPTAARRMLAVEVRSDEGPVLSASITYELTRH